MTRRTNRRKSAKRARPAPDLVFLDSLDISEEPVRRKLEVYEEARRLRREVFWFEEPLYASTSAADR